MIGTGWKNLFKVHKTYSHSLYLFQQQIFPADLLPAKSLLVSSPFFMWGWRSYSIFVTTQFSCRENRLKTNIFISALREYSKYPFPSGPTKTKTASQGKGTTWGVYPWLQGKPPLQGNQIDKDPLCFKRDYILISTMFLPIRNHPDMSS